jgi:hypothetical protein
MGLNEPDKYWMRLVGGVTCLLSGSHLSRVVDCCDPHAMLVGNMPHLVGAH